MSAEEYIKSRMSFGTLDLSDIADLVRYFQGREGLLVDGKPGAKTMAALDATKGSPEDLTIKDGWLQGPGVDVLPAHPSWFYRDLATAGGPRAIVAHYSATAYGTAESMAARRQVPRKVSDRAASWHVSIEGDGSIVQMVPFTGGAWHSRGKIPGLGAPNRTSVGIELIGHGDKFPPAQVDSACKVWRVLVETYVIRMDRAMIQHSELDPKRRKDPGPVWMGEHAEGVLEYAYNG